jgi:hypothetical protein
MTTTTGDHLNQVDLSAVGALVEKIKERPSAGRTRWSAEVRWTGAPVGQTLSQAIPVQISAA